MLSRERCFPLSQRSNKLIAEREILSARIQSVCSPSGRSIDRYFQDSRCLRMKCRMEFLNLHSLFRHLKISWQAVEPLAEFTAIVRRHLSETEVASVSRDCIAISLYPSTVCENRPVDSTVIIHI